MPVNDNYAEEIQKLGLGAEVILYQIDMTPLGGPILYYVPMAADGTGLGNISFGGQVYTPFPIIAEGFEWASGRAPAQPTVSVANQDHAMTGYILQYGSLVGAKFNRIRTFQRFLDGSVEPDGSAHMPIDMFRFEKKTLHNDTLVSWDMSSWIDQQGVLLPKRLIIRDYCPLQYRNGKSGTFDYSKATCPYTDTPKFKFDNTTTTVVSEDVCAHTLKACKLRFGSAPLPFGGFPGVAKYRA